MADVQGSVTGKKKGEPQPEKGMPWWLTGLLVGLVIGSLFGIYWLASLKIADSGPHELPHIAVQIEVNEFDPATRTAIANFEKGLVLTGLFDVFGPADATYLLPPAESGPKVPQHRKFEAMTKEEWDTAWPYFTAGDWLVPRLFRTDGKACVVRIAPKAPSTQFAPDAATKFEDVVKDAGSPFKSIKAYSSSAGIGGTPERDALNVTFGATTAWVKLTRSQSAEHSLGWLSPDGLRLLQQVRPTVGLNPRVRTVTTPLGWVKYFVAVRDKTTKDPEAPSDGPTIEQAFTYAHANQVNALVTQDGLEALVDVTTDAEGRDNAELYFYLASTLQEQIRVNVKGYVPKLPKGPSKKSE
jgi:hypothetical protein